MFLYANPEFGTMFKEDLAKLDGSYSSDQLCLAALQAFRKRKHDLFAKRISTQKLFEQLHKSVHEICELRPHEPVLANAFNYIFNPASLYNLDKPDLDREVERRILIVHEYIDNAHKKVAALGAKKIKKGMSIYTHSHSSHVMAVLKEAAKTTNFRVFVTETRPHYLGRQAAKELADAGIVVHYFADSGVRLAVKQADMVLLGADAIDYDCRVYNKLGAEMACEIAYQYHNPVYICTDSLKYDTHSVVDRRESIPRDPDELWKAPKGIIVENFGYEKIHPELIQGFITELGIYKTKELVTALIKAYPHWFGQ